MSNFEMLNNIEESFDGLEGYNILYNIKDYQPPPKFPEYDGIIITNNNYNMEYYNYSYYIMSLISLKTLVLPSSLAMLGPSLKKTSSSPMKFKFLLYRVFRLFP